ncbi:MarR family winged helix-turn-helix transcriptional regulator [Uliginosibacterium sp. sgz301328]|uniref:MarR family winged helix-turn-helix transcriptional regulator n=1 Tax=Uliginosibacterium sp. sgz301328 TaxID=3243764 RepID=UPI00359D9F47
MTHRTAPDDGHELFYYAYRAFTAAPDAMLERRGWGRVHHRLLHFIGRNPGIAVNQLLDKLGVSKQALHGPLKALIEAGLVVAEASTDDRRVRQLGLTEAGRKAEEELSGPQLSLLRDVFAECGEDAVRQWDAVMRALARRQRPIENES